MAASSINVTEGSGKRLNTWDRTISSVLVQDQFTLPGEYPYPTYVALAGSISIATLDAHVIELMAGSSKNVRIRRIRMEQSASTSAANATATIFQLFRLDSAGSGGTAVTPAKFNTADAASDATARTLPSTKGNETTEVLRWTLVSRKALSDTSAQSDDVYEWTQHPGEGPIVIAAGTSNGVCVKTASAVAGATVHITIEFVETDF